MVKLHPETVKDIGLPFANSFARLAYSCEAAMLLLTNFADESVMQAQMLIRHSAPVVMVGNLVPH